MLVGALEIKLFAELARLRSDMDKANSIVAGGVKGISSSVNLAKTALGALGIGFGVGYFASLIKGSIDAQDHLNDLAKTTQLPVEQLAGLASAAKKSGADLDTTAASINKLAQNMGKDAEKFAALGITAKDPLVAFGQLADVMNAIDDPQTRAAVGAAALGKGWQTAAPLLAEGSAEIAKLVKNGAELSGVTKESAEQADKFNDQLVDLGTVSKALSTSIGNQLLPGMIDITQAMVQASKEGGILKAIWVGLGGLGSHLFTDDDLSRADQIGKKIGSLQKQMEGFAQAQAARGGTFNDKNITALAAQIKTLEAERTALEKVQAPAAAAPKAAAPNKSALDNLIGRGGASGKSARVEIDDVTKALQAMAKEWSEVGKSGSDLEVFRLQTMGATQSQLLLAKSMLGTIDAAKKQAEIAAVMKGLEEEAATLGKTSSELKIYQLESLGASAADIERARSILAATDAQREQQAIMEEGKRVFEETRTPIERLHAEYERLNVLQQKGAIDQDTYSRAVLKAQDEFANATQKKADIMDEFAKNAAKNIQDSLADFLFDPFAKGLDGMLAGFGKFVQRAIAEAVAADLTKRLFGAAGGGTGGGGAGDLLGMLGGLFGGGNMGAGGMGPPAPSGSGGGVLLGLMGLFSSFAVGTDYVPRDQLARVHQGERIVPESQNRGGSGHTIIVNVTGNNGPDVRRAAGQGAREALGALSTAQRYK